MVFHDWEAKMTKLRKLFIVLCTCFTLSTVMAGMAACNSGKEPNYSSSSNSVSVSESVDEETPNFSSVEEESSEEEIVSSELESSEEDVVGPLLYQLGDKMKDFSITTPYGKTITLYEELQKKDMVVLNFWATWCTPCNNELPALNHAYSLYEDSVT